MIVVSNDISASLGPARSQGTQRRTCTAFAVSDMNALANKVGEHLSVDYLCHYAAKIAGTWLPGQGFTAGQALGAAAVPGQPIESLHPYMAADQDSPLKAPAANLLPLYASVCTARALTADAVVKRIGAGAAVGLVIAMTQSLYVPVGGIVSFDPMVIPNEYHAMVGVGVGEHAVTKEPYVLVRNSWGVKWGQAGHAWIPLKHLQLHLYEGFTL